MRFANSASCVSSPRPERVAPGSTTPRAAARLAWRLALLTLRDRYAATALGGLWAVLQPAGLIAVYWFVFSYGLKMAAPAEGGSYFLTLTVGLIVWFFFSEAVAGGTNAVLANRYLVKKIAFPLEILPCIPVLAALVVHAAMIALVLAVMAAEGRMPSTALFEVAYFALALACLATGLAFLLSGLAVFQGDMAQSIGILLQIWFWLTPIVWSPDLFPEHIRGWLALNPLYYIVTGYRHAFLDTPAVPLFGTAGAIFWIAAALMLAAGIAVFRRLKPDFADVL